MKLKRSHIVLLAVIVAAVAVALVYTRPMTLEALYPVLDIDECIGLEASYLRYGDAEWTRLELAPGDAAFGEVISLFQGRKFSRSLINLISDNTAKTHRYEEGDFKWDIYFEFDDVAYPDGSIGRGTLLGVTDFYGVLEMRHDGRTLRYSTAAQDEFVSEVMATIAK